ncbi:hypothetical protein [Schlesneria paludicola]|uniref:hypothetical protein n=1 Tax=Schlesneria paludicola TaxID=360056 RepID=UPI00029B0C5D|nr:hypothetical protein [Schlesneria paludicola]
MKQTQNSPKWWSAVATLSRLGWTGSTPLASLADIGEPRIGVMSDAFMRPMLIEACGLSSAALARLRRSAPDDPEFSQILSVHVVDSDDSTVTAPLAGHYVLDRTRLTFIPNAPLQSGHAYRAILRVSNGVPDASPSADFTIHREIRWDEPAHHPVTQARQSVASIN